MLTASARCCWIVTAKSSDLAFEPYRAQFKSQRFEKEPGRQGREPYLRSRQANTWLANKGIGHRAKCISAIYCNYLIIH